jgi:Zn-dependent peptidase ImmA (M78 family)/DNA-binding XRE family transcriptional regulator
MRQAVNVNMVILARESRGINQSELANRIGFAPAFMSKLEKGDAPLSEDHLKAISDITRYPISFFYQEGDIVPENIAYRKRETVAQKVLTIINARVNIVRLHVKHLSEELGIPMPIIPTIQTNEAMSPSKVAQEIRKAWGIKKGIIDNMVDLVERNNISVKLADFGTERVDSRTVLTDNKYPIIVLNKVLLGDRQRFSLAYQLGHLVMHTYKPVDWNIDVSHEANLFAAEFLMPEKEIRDEFKDGVTLALLAELKRKWKVSMISLLYRADDLGFLTDNQKRYLVQQFNDKKIRRREPVELDVAMEQPKLFRQWIAYLKKKKKLDAAGMATELHLHTDEFVELYG